MMSESTRTQDEQQSPAIHVPFHAPLLISLGIHGLLAFFLLLPGRPPLPAPESPEARITFRLQLKAPGSDPVVAPNDEAEPVETPVAEPGPAESPVAGPADPSLARPAPAESLVSVPVMPEPEAAEAETATLPSPGLRLPRVSTVREAVGLALEREGAGQMPDCDRLQQNNPLLNCAPDVAGVMQEESNPVYLFFNPEPQALPETGGGDPVSGKANLERMLWQINVGDRAWQQRQRILGRGP